MSADDTYREILARATEVVGGAQALCDRLQVPIATMTRWLAGDGRPPMGVFLRAVDIIADERDKPRLLPPTDL